MLGGSQDPTEAWDQSQSINNVITISPNSENPGCLVSEQHGNMKTQIFSEQWKPYLDKNVRFITI